MNKHREGHPWTPAGLTKGPESHIPLLLCGSPQKPEVKMCGTPWHISNAINTRESRCWHPASLKQHQPLQLKSTFHQRILKEKNSPVTSWNSMAARQILPLWMFQITFWSPCAAQALLWFIKCFKGLYGCFCSGRSPQRLRPHCWLRAACLCLSKIHSHADFVPSSQGILQTKWFIISGFL